MGIKRIGFIGLGAMGLPMAKNLQKNGYELHVTAHSNRKPVEELTAGGAIEHKTVADIVANCDVLISILPTDKEMESVLLAEEVLKELTSDKKLIEMTSGSPAMMKKLYDVYHEIGVPVLDAPVSGGTAGAENGTLTVMVGGEETVLKESRELIMAMAAKIYLVGAIGAGKAIKAINQMLASIHMIASAEAVALAEELEIDKEQLRNVIGSSSGASWMLNAKLDSLTDRNFEPGFKLKLMKKDVKIAVDEAGNLNLPLVTAALELYEEAEQEFGDLDFSAVGKKSLK